ATVDIAIGESVAFDAQPRDRNDNPLSVPVTWASSNTEVATIGPDGVAMALAAGRATIRASAGGVTGGAGLVVRSVPRAPAGLEAGISGATGGDFELTWQDRSDDETYFAIERSVNDGPWERIGS